MERFPLFHSHQVRSEQLTSVTAKQNTDDLRPVRVALLSIPSLFLWSQVPVMRVVAYRGQPPSLDLQQLGKLNDDSRVLTR